jgi:hypothetical protein
MARDVAERHAGGDTDEQRRREHARPTRRSRWTGWSARSSRTLAESGQHVPSCSRPIHSWVADPVRLRAKHHAAGPGRGHSGWVAAGWTAPCFHGDDQSGHERQVFGDDRRVGPAAQASAVVRQREPEDGQARIPRSPGHSARARPEPGLARGDQQSATTLIALLFRVVLSAAARRA